VFRALEDEAYFVQRVGEHFRSAPVQLQPILLCAVTVDDARLRYAHKEYVQDIDRFSLFLQSGDPDHYKRAGALLHALYLSEPIVTIDFDPELESVDTLITEPGISYGDAEGALSFGHFYDEYHNEFTAFSLAYDACNQYGNGLRLIDFDYVHTVCTYLKNNGNLSVESLFMIFKSLTL
jgi:hypothetical protein